MVTIVSKKGPLYKITRKSDGKVGYATNWQLIRFVMTITENNPNIAYSEHIKARYDIEKLENPTPAEWLLFAEEDELE